MRVSRRVKITLDTTGNSIEDLVSLLQDAQSNGATTFSPRCLKAPPHDQRERDEYWLDLQ